MGSEESGRLAVRISWISRRETCPNSAIRRSPTPACRSRWRWACTTLPSTSTVRTGSRVTRDVSADAFADRHCTQPHPDRYRERVPWSAIVG